jgi:hypothetical protein
VTLHCGLQVEHFLTLPHSLCLCGSGPCQPTRAMVIGTVCDVEKNVGNTLVMKMRAILLMEADFNATNKIVYGNRMLHSAGTTT